MCVDFSDALSSSISALYAKIIVIIGIALPVTEVLTSRITTIVYQSFYVYLYVISILFVVYVYTAHMRTRAVFSLIKTYRKYSDFGYRMIITTLLPFLLPTNVKSEHSTFGLKWNPCDRITKPTQLIHLHSHAKWWCRWWWCRWWKLW